MSLAYALRIVKTKIFIITNGFLKLRQNETVHHSFCRSNEKIDDNKGLFLFLQNESEHLNIYGT